MAAIRLLSILRETDGHRDGARSIEAHGMKFNSPIRSSDAKFQTLR